MANTYQQYEKLLTERGITSYQVAKETGIATSSLSEWKNGGYNIKLDKLILIAQYFNVPLDYFIAEGGEQNG